MLRQFSSARHNTHVRRYCPDNKKPIYGFGWFGAYPDSETSIQEREQKHKENKGFNNPSLNEKQEPGGLAQR